MSLLILRPAGWSPALTSSRHVSQAESEQDLFQHECCTSLPKPGLQGRIFSGQEPGNRGKRVSRRNSVRKPASSLTGKASVAGEMRSSTNAERITPFNRMDPSLLKSTGISDGPTKQSSQISLPQLRNSDEENWRILSHTLASRQNFSAISNRDLMKLAELRFSNDMQEGDSGSQVLLLQKALCWLGFLSSESDITGYFGTETKQALCEFQEAHGVNRTAIWTSLSKQALWHIISGEILHRVADEKIVNVTEPKSNGNLHRKLQTWQQLIPVKLAEGPKTTAPIDEWRILSGIALLVAGIVCGLIISKSFRKDPGNDSIIKRQIIPTKQRTSLSPKEDLLSSSSANGAVTGGKIMQKRHDNMNYMNNMEAVKHSDNVYGTSNVTLDPLFQQKMGSGIPSTFSTLSTFKNSEGRTANNSRMPLSNLESSKSAQRKSMQMPTNSKPHVESTILSKRSDSCIRPQQYHEARETKSAFSGKQDFISNGRQDSLSVMNSPLQGSNSRGLIPPSQNAKIARPNKHLETDIPKDEWTSILNRELEPNIKRRIEELRKAVEVAEQNGQAAVHALEEERKRSIELEKKISRQKESAEALEKEVRVLKESHDELLESLRKKVDSSTSQGFSLLYKRPNHGDDNDKVR